MLKQLGKTDGESAGAKRGKGGRTSISILALQDTSALVAA